MKKVLLTTVFGALFMTSSLSAKPQAGSLSYDIDLTAGVVFLSNIKTDGATVVGGDSVTITDAKAATAANTAPAAPGGGPTSVFTSQANNADKGTAAKITPLYTPTTTFTKKPGICAELTGGISYWCTNSVGVGFDLGYSVISARVKDKATSNTSRISHSLSIMPNVSFYMTDKLVLNVGIGVAWTKVRDLEIGGENAVTLDAGKAISTVTDDVFKSNVDALLNGKYYIQDILSREQVAQNGAGMDIGGRMAYFATALNNHNNALNKAFKNKPGFVTKIALSYVYDANTKLSLGYKYTNVKMKTRYNGMNRFKCAMHTFTATYTYNF